MTVVLGERADLTLDGYRRVAWDGECTRLSPEALDAIDGVVHGM